MSSLTDHVINSRTLTSYHPIEKDLTFNKQHNYLFDLSYLGVLDVIGDKSSDFLQGQLTCDMRKLSDIQMLQGVQCNLKGRVLSLLDVVYWQGIKLILPKDLLELTSNSLNKTALLSRVALQANHQLKVLGFYLQNPQDLIPNSIFLPTSVQAQAEHSDFCYYHLGSGLYIFLIYEDKAMDLAQPFIEKDQFRGSLTWHTLQLYKRQFAIYPESRGLFLPHRLGLHETQQISFDKGCYKGQEIIARMHYKAVIKHGLKFYTVETKSKIYSGQKVFAVDNNSELGELVDYSLLGEDRYLIALSIVKESHPSVRLEGSEEVLHLEYINA